MFLILCLIFFTSFLLYHFYWKRLHLPPGPTPFPIVGNGPQFSGKNCYSAFQRWTKEYGPVFTIWIGQAPVVVVTDYELMKQAFGKEEFAGRNFLNNHFKLFFGEVDGLIRTEGEQWKQMKKFTLKSMREYGLGKGVMETQVLEAIFKVIDEVEEEMQLGKREHAIDRKVDLMTGSVINRILFGYSFYGEHLAEFTFLKDMLDIQQEYYISLISLMIEARPWLRFLPYFWSKYRLNEWATKKLFEFVDKEIHKRVEARKSGQNSCGDEEASSSDIIDQFIDQMDQTDQNDANNFFKLWLKYLSALCFDLFLAGQETTSNTLNFLILYLMLDQRAQDKLHAELDAVADEKKRQEGEAEVKFRMADRLQLPYTNAIVQESLRMANLLPLNLSKVLKKDVEIGGHKLSEGTAIINQIATVLYDEKIFPEPDKFIPERFLCQDEHQIKKVDELIPFSIGKRICPGEPLGRMELLLFTANFFNKFHVYPPDPLNPPKYEKRHTFAVKLPEYKCDVRIRH